MSIFIIPVWFQPCLLFNRRAKECSCDINTSTEYNLTQGHIIIIILIKIILPHNLIFYGYQVVLSLLTGNEIFEVVYNFVSLNMVKAWKH